MYLTYCWFLGDVSKWVNFFGQESSLRCPSSSTFVSHAIFLGLTYFCSRGSIHGKRERVCVRQATSQMRLEIASSVKCPGVFAPQMLVKKLPCADSTYDIHKVFGCFDHRYKNI